MYKNVDMKVIQFNNVKYEVPESWEEVTLGMVIKVQENLDILPNAELVCLISGYVGIPLEELKSSKLTQVNKIIKLMSFVYKEYRPKLKNSFVYDGQEYRMEVEVQSIRFEDYVSAQTVLYNYREHPIKGLSKLVAVLCKKPQELIDDVNLEERSKLFEQVPWTDIKNVEFFFTRALRVYEQVSQLSLTESQMVEVIRAMVKELRTTMKLSRVRSGGIWFTRLRTLYFRLYLWYLNRELERYFSSILSKPLETS